MSVERSPSETTEPGTRVRSPFGSFVNVTPVAVASPRLASARLVLQRVAGGRLAVAVGVDRELRRQVGVDARRAQRDDRDRRVQRARGVRVVGEHLGRLIRAHLALRADRLHAARERVGDASADLDGRGRAAGQRAQRRGHGAAVDRGRPARGLGAERRRVGVERRGEARVGRRAGAVVEDRDLVLDRVAGRDVGVAVGVVDEPVAHGGRQQRRGDDRRRELVLDRAVRVAGAVLPAHGGAVGHGAGRGRGQHVRGLGAGALTGLEPAGVGAHRGAAAAEDVVGHGEVERGL